MSIEEFINKWNVAYESKEQQIEFATEMRSDIEQIINERPAPEGADEVLFEYTKISKLRGWVCYNDVIKAMHTFAAQEVAKAVKAKDEEWVKLSQDVINRADSYEIGLLKTELTEAKKALAEKDAEIADIKDERETMIQAFNDIRAAFEGREWITQGRGSYKYNDDRYMEEAKYLFKDFKKIEREMWNQIKSKSYEYRKSIENPLKSELTEAKKALEEKDAEIERITMYYDTASKYNREANIELNSIKSELTEAKKRIESLEESNKRLQFMVDNGLGDKDMENTIENAKIYLIGRLDYESTQDDVARILVQHANEITAERDRTIADLRRQLAECKAKGRHGLNQSDKFGL